MRTNPSASLRSLTEDQLSRWRREAEGALGIHLPDATPSQEAGDYRWLLALLADIDAELEARTQAVSHTDAKGA